MSVVQFHCPLCTGLFQVDDALAGIEVNCPHCQGLITVPGFDAPAPPPPPPPTPLGEVMELGCPMCTGMFQVTPDMAGQQVACPHCHQLVGIPEFGAPSEAPPPPPDVGANWLPPSMPPGWSPAVPTPPESLGLPPGFEIPRGRAVSEPSNTGPMLPPASGPMLPPTTLPPSNWPPPKTPSPTTPQPVERKEQRPVPRQVAPTPLPETPGPKKRDDAFPPSKPTGPIESRKSVSPPVQKQAEYLPPTSAPVEDLLPQAAVPGAQFSAPTADSLLPSAANAEAPVERKPLPMVVPEKSEAILIPLESGGYMAVREPVKTVRHRGEEIELRKLTPEEKEQRKFVRNAFLFVFSIVILLGVMAALSWKQIFK